MYNEISPVPPNKSCGCFNCGNGKNEILISRTIGGMSKALCLYCDQSCDPESISRLPFQAR